MAQPFLIMDPADNVAVVLLARQPGDVIAVPAGPLTIRDPIPVGHKVALREIREGDYVIKYGERIGRATASIPAGAHAHVHNMYDITEEVYEAERRKLGL